MVVVTINILVIHPQSLSMPHQVKRLVLEVPEELVLLEVVKKKRKKKNEKYEKLYKNNYEF